MAPCKPCAHQCCMSRNNALSTGRMGGCRRAKEFAPRCYFASAIARHDYRGQGIGGGCACCVQLTLVCFNRISPNLLQKLF